MPLPFARTAPQARPTFSRDFAGLKTLDHGVGPAITFTRGSDATYFNAAGTLTTATTNEPRFDHNPSSGASLGLLIEEARTNSIRNSQAGGATAGVIGSGGALPTNWSASTHAGIVYEVIGTGTSAGLSYIDIKISGTNSSGSPVTPAINLETTTQIVAANGQTWSGSSYVALVGGSLSGVSVVEIDIVERSVGGSYLAGTQANISSTVTSSLRRFSVSRTFNQATTERTTVRIVSNVPNGNTVDLTLRIAAPQLEQGAFPTSYIPTTNAAATRAADSAVVTPISSFYNQAEGTLFAEVQRDTLNTTYAMALSVDDNSFDNRIALALSGGSGRRFRFSIHAAAALQWEDTNVGDSSVWPTKVIGAFRAADFAASVQGGTVKLQAAGTLPSVTHFQIGQRGGTTTSHLNGHIRKIAYWPRRLSNTLLQQLTT